MITYTLPSGCTAIRTVTVNTSPSGITGATHVCVGATTTLGDLIGGGIWSSSIPATATIGTATGTLGGILSGTVTVTYSLGAGCSISTPVTINPLPLAITGTATVCAGSTTTFSDGGLGTWSITGSSVATVVTASGLITGVALGTTPVTYTLPTGCMTTKAVSVNALPGAITGVMHVCPGMTTTLGSSPGAGTWTSAALPTATVVSGSGVVTGVIPGTALISYTIGTGCTRSATVTVNTLPVAFPVTGGGSYCATGMGVPIGIGGSVTGVTYQLYNGAVTAAPSVAGTGTGFSFGVFTAAGTYTVSATSAATGCSQPMTGSATITINPLPPAIGGPSAVCVGATMLETNGISGGTWTIGSSAVATVTAGPAGGGIVTGVTTGPTTLTYTLPTTCAVSTTITVSLSPTAIIGGPTVCQVHSHVAYRWRRRRLVDQQQYISGNSWFPWRPAHRGAYRHHQCHLLIGHRLYRQQGHER